VHYNRPTVSNGGTASNAAQTMNLLFSRRNHLTFYIHNGFLSGLRTAHTRTKQFVLLSGGLRCSRITAAQLALYAASSNPPLRTHGSRSGSPRLFTLITNRTSLDLVRSKIHRTRTEVRQASSAPLRVRVPPAAVSLLAFLQFATRTARRSNITSCS